MDRIVVDEGLACHGLRDSLAARPKIFASEEVASNRSRRQLESALGASLAPDHPIP